MEINPIIVAHAVIDSPTSSLQPPFAGIWSPDFSWTHCLLGTRHREWVLFTDLIIHRAVFPACCITITVINGVADSSVTHLPCSSLSLASLKSPCCWFICSTISRVGGWQGKKIILDLQLISIGLIYFYNSQPGTLIRDGYNQKTGKKKESGKKFSPRPSSFLNCSLSPQQWNGQQPSFWGQLRRIYGKRRPLACYSGMLVTNWLFTDASVIFCWVNMILPGRPDWTSMQ